MQHPVRAALSVREVDEGLELHDRGSGSVHRLNPVASAVWRLCDGNHDLPAIAASVARQFGASLEQVTPDVSLLLTQFADLGLTRSGGTSPAVEELLLRCVQRALPGAAAAPRRELPDPVDWDALVRLALRHGVLPLVQRHVAACAPTPVPEVVRERIDSHCARIAADNRRLLLELLDLLELFARSGIPAVSLKGPLFAATVYGDVSARQLTDLDLFVPPNRVHEAIAVLQGRDHVVSRRQVTDLYTYRPSDGVTIDLQWVLAQSEWRVPIDLAELWTRLETTAVEERLVSLPRPDDCLRFLCAHGAKHCWCSIKWIADVALLVERHQTRIDWPALVVVARRRGGLRQLLLGLRLAHDLLGSSLPPAVATLITRDPVVATLAVELRDRLFVVSEAPTHQGSYGYLESRWLYARTRERSRDVAPLLFEMARRFVTPTERDRAVLALPRPLAWGYYLVRPVRLLASRLKPPT
jgi:hypothetical protein